MDRACDDLYTACLWCEWVCLWIKIPFIWTHLDALRYCSSFSDAQFRDQKTKKCACAQNFAQWFLYNLNVYLMYSPSLGKIQVPLQPLCIKEFIMLLCVYFKKNKYMLLCFSNYAWFVLLLSARLNIPLYRESMHHSVSTKPTLFVDEWSHILL